MQYLQILKPNANFSVTKACLKGCFLIFLGKALFFNQFGWAGEFSTPRYLCRYYGRHPANPPIFEPHQFDQPEDYEKYTKLIFEIEKICRNNLTWYYYRRRDHPSLENGRIITEAYFDSEAERIWDELRGEIKREHRKSKQEFESSIHEIERRVQYQRLTGNIKPL